MLAPSHSLETQDFKISPVTGLALLLSSTTEKSSYQATIKRAT